MENSRHERSIVVVASYVIGFTSAFIAFYNGQAQTTTEVVVQPQIQQEVANNSVEEQYPSATLRIDETGLFVVVEGSERMLSARRSYPPLASVISSEPQPGLAHRLTEAELSRDNKFVYFCEQLTATAETCSPYIYSIFEDVLYPVTLADESYTPSNSGHTSSWTLDGNLMINSYTSVSADRPWVIE